MSYGEVYNIYFTLKDSAQPPDLEVREIGELTVDQFRGIFRLSYDGDAHIVLKTKVQVRNQLLDCLYPTPYT